MGVKSSHKEYDMEKSSHMKHDKQVADTKCDNENAAEHKNDCSDTNVKKSTLRHDAKEFIPRSSPARAMRADAGEFIPSGEPRSIINVYMLADHTFKKCDAMRDGFMQPNSVCWCGTTVHAPIILETSMQDFKNDLAKEAAKAELAKKAAKADDTSTEKADDNKADEKEATQNSAGKADDKQAADDDILINMQDNFGNACQLQCKPTTSLRIVIRSYRRRYDIGDHDIGIKLGNCQPVARRNDDSVVTPDSTIQEYGIVSGSTIALTFKPLRHDCPPIGGQFANNQLEARAHKQH